MTNTDKRSVSTDALETLGTIIGLDEKRDAIHLAVEPVEAGERLYPGQLVGIVDGKAVNAKAPKFLGIVDPFLSGLVLPGDRFWLVVFPRQITSLRHVWTHPDFAEPAADAGARQPNKEASEMWLREFVSSADCPSYEEVLAAAVRNLNDEELYFGGFEAHGNIPPEFWVHVENVTGKKILPEHRAKYFSCSC